MTRNMVAVAQRRLSKELPQNMNVQINGEERDFEGPLTVETVLQRLGFDPRKIAVERNLEIVPKGTYGGTAVQDGDRLEIVHFIGGGASALEPQAAEEYWGKSGKRTRSLIPRSFSPARTDRIEGFL